MSLLELIGRADERALAAGAVACLERCLPLLAGPEAEPSRPLWASCENGQEWAIRLAAVRTEMERASVSDGPAALVRAMLGAAPPTSPPRLSAGVGRRLLAGRARVHGRFDAPDGDVPADEERPAQGGPQR